MNLLNMVKLLESKAVSNVIYNMYMFHPANKLVYRKFGNEKIYMDYEEVMNLEFTIFSTLLFLPDAYDENGDALNDVGWFDVCVGGEQVINENN